MILTITVPRYLWSAFLVTFLVLVHRSEGQGRMLDPPGRSSLWRFGYKTPINYNDNVVSCGGVKHQWAKNAGKCGVCGDPWDMAPRDHETGGRFASGIIARQYTSGSTINVTLDIGVNNGGFFEFRLCANNDVIKPVQDDCFQAGLLTIKNSDDSKSPQSQYEVRRAGQTTVEVFLPTGLTCSQCVLQWKYTTADHYGCDVSKTGERQCCFGCGEIQTTYYACADIAIVDSETKTRVSYPEESVRNRRNRVKRRAIRRSFVQKGGVLGIGMANPFDIVSSGNNRQFFTTYRPEQIQFTTFNPGVNTAAPETVWNWRSASSSRSRTNQNEGMVINAYPRNPMGFNGNIRVNNMVAAENIAQPVQRTSANAHLNRQGAFSGPRSQATAFVRVGEAEPQGVFQQVGSSHVQQSFVAGSLEPQLTMTRVRQQSIATQVTNGKGKCKYVGQYRSAAMDDWCNKQCAGQSPCAINGCSCPARQYDKKPLVVDTCSKCPFGICWDDTTSLEDVFPGLFANPATFLQCNELEELFTIGNYKVVSEGLPECNNFRFKRQAIQFDDDDGGCCATRPQVIMPLTVESKNETYNVVQLPNDRNQLLVQGICRRNATLSCSVCVEQSNFQWVLVFDSRINSSPPVTFVPVRFPHYCRCRNPGGLLVKKNSNKQHNVQKTVQIHKTSHRTVTVHH